MNEDIKKKREELLKQQEDRRKSYNELLHQENMGPFQIKCRNASVSPYLLEFLPKDWPKSPEAIETALFEASQKSYNKYTESGGMMGTNLLETARILWRYRPEEMRKKG